MWEYIAKIAVTVAVVITIAEVGKRSSLWGAVLALLPLTSLLSFVWLYLDTGNARAVADLSRGIFWLALASLPLFLILPALLRGGFFVLVQPRHRAFGYDRYVHWSGPAVAAGRCPLVGSGVRSRLFHFRDLRARHPVPRRHRPHTSRCAADADTTLDVAADVDRNVAGRMIDSSFATPWRPESDR